MKTDAEGRTVYLHLDQGDTSEVGTDISIRRPSHTIGKVVQDSHHSYSEIGSCLQHLRRSVVDMYQKDFHDVRRYSVSHEDSSSNSSTKYANGDYRDFSGMLDKHQKRVGQLLSNHSSLSSSVDQLSITADSGRGNGIHNHSRTAAGMTTNESTDGIHSFLQTHFKLLASFRQTTDMQEMQRLYENLAYQLRQQFDERSSLGERNAQLEQRLKKQEAQFHSRYVEMKAEFDTKLQSAKQLAEAVNEQYNANRSMERQLLDKERDLHASVTELNSKLLSCENDLASSRLQLQQAQKTINLLHDEVAQTRAAKRDCEVDLEEARRMLQESSRSAAGKEEQMRAAQKECAELRGSLDKSWMMKAELEAKLKSARKLVDEASEQSSTNRNWEMKLYNTERELNARINELDAMYEVSRADSTSLRTQLEAAEQRVASLQEEVMVAHDSRRDCDISLDDLRRKHKELLKSLATKDEQLTALQKECIDLHTKLKRPFIVSSSRSKGLADSTDRRIGHDYEVMRLKEEVAAAKDSERESQKLCLTSKLLKEAALNEVESLKRELISLKKQSEQAERLQSAAEQKLSAATLQTTRLEDSMEKIRASNSELMLSNQSIEATVSDLREQHFFQQQELLKATNDLRKAMETVEEYKRIVSEKDKLVSNLKQFNQNLQASMSSQTVDGIDLKAQYMGLETSTQRTITELQHSMQLSEQEVISKSMQIKALLADANSSAIKLARIPVLESAIAELETTNKQQSYEKLSLMEEIKATNNVVSSLQDKVRSQAVAQQTCSEEIISSKAEVVVQQQQNKMLRQELEMARLDASTTAKQLDASKQEVSSTASQLEEARREADSSCKELDAVRLELLSTRNKLMITQNQFNHVNNEKTGLQVHCSRVEKAHLQVITAIKLDIESLPQVVDSKSGGAKALPSSAVPLSKGSDAADEDKVYQLLMDTAAQLKAKNRDLHKYFKARKNADRKHYDSLSEWLDSLNEYAEKAIQPALNNRLSSPSKLSNRHLHHNIAISSDNIELMSRVAAVEVNLSLLAQKIKAKSDEISSLMFNLSGSNSHIEKLNSRLSTAESSLTESQSQLSDCQQRIELLALQEEALIRNRDRLENDLSVLDDKYRASMMHQDELKHSLSVTEDDLTSTKQELIDARIAIDEIYLDLQSCRNELSASKQAHAAVAAEKESLEGDLFTVRRERDHGYDDLKQMKDRKDAREMQMAILQNNWKNMEDECKQLQREKVESEMKIEELLREISSLSSMLADVRTERTNLVASVDALNREKSELGLKLGEAKGDTSELGLRLHEIQKDFENRLEGSQRENAELKQTIDELCSEKSMLLSKLQGLQRSEKEALSDAAEMKTQLSLKDKSLSSLEDRIAALQTEVHEKSIEVTSLQPFVMRFKSAKEDSLNMKNIQIELQKRFDQCVIQLDRYRRSSEQLSKSQSESDQRNVDLQSRLLKLDDEHSDLLARSTSLEQQLASYVHLDSDYKTVSHSLTVKVAESQLLKDQLDVEKQSSLQLRSSLDAISLQNKQYELQQELLTRKLEVLTEEHSKKTEELTQLRAEQAAQQQQLMGALKMQLDDTRYKHDLSESSLRVLDEQLKSKASELERQEQMVLDLSKQKAYLDHKLMLAENSSQLLLNSMKQLQSRCDTQEVTIRDTCRKLESSNKRVLQLEHEVSMLDDQLSTREGAMSQLQHRHQEKVQDLTRKERSLEEASLRVQQLTDKLDSVTQRKDAELLDFNEYTIILDRNHDEYYQTMQNSLDAKEAQIQLLTDQLNEETSRSVQCKTSLDVMSLQNKQYELQQELLTRKLEVLTEEHSKKTEELTQLRAEQAAQQQQLMGALKMQLDDTRYKHDLSESSLRVLDEQLKSKASELERQEQMVLDLSKQKAYLDHKLMLAENSSQHLETAMKQLQSKYNAQQTELQEATRTLEFFSTRAFQLESELSVVRAELSAREGAMDELQLRYHEQEMDLQRKVRLLGQASTAMTRESQMKTGGPPAILNHHHHHLESSSMDQQLFEQLNFNEYTVILDNKHSADSAHYL